MFANMESRRGRLERSFYRVAARHRPKLGACVETWSNHRHNAGDRTPIRERPKGELQAAGNAVVRRPQ
jgi:hypothetical protein